MSSISGDAFCHLAGWIIKISTSAPLWYVHRNSLWQYFDYRTSESHEKGNKSNRNWKDKNTCQNKTASCCKLLLHKHSVSAGGKLTNISVDFSVRFSILWADFFVRKKIAYLNMIQWSYTCELGLACRKERDHIKQKGMSHLNFCCNNLADILTQQLRSPNGGLRRMETSII